jgi:hypothetical protein
MTCCVTNSNASVVVMSEGTAKGNAEFSIDEERKIQLASNIKSMYSYYQGYFPLWPSQHIETEGCSTITTWPNNEVTDIKGIVKSDGMALHSRLDPFKGGAIYNPYYYQRTRASTNAKLIYGDNTVKGTAQVIQYTEHQKDTLVHEVLITNGANIELKDNSEESKITIKKGDVEYWNNGDSKHPEKPFKKRSGQCDILLEKKQPATRCVEIHSSSTNPGDWNV